jgi:hypothetical protein
VPLAFGALQTQDNNNINMMGESSQDFKQPKGHKRKRTLPQQISQASTSIETSNHFSILSDSDGESASTDSAPPGTMNPPHIPPIVVYSYFTNHTQTIQQSIRNIITLSKSKQNQTGYCLIHKKNQTMKYSYAKSKTQK